MDFWQGLPGMPFVFEQPDFGNPDENRLNFDPGDGRLLTVFTNEGGRDAVPSASHEISSVLPQHTIYLSLTRHDTALTNRDPASSRCAAPYVSRETEPLHARIFALPMALVALGKAGAQTATAPTSATPRAPAAMSAIREADLKRDLYTLAGDAMRGREAGTLDEMRASMWLA